MSKTQTPHNLSALQQLATKRGATSSFPSTGLEHHQILMLNQSSQWPLGSRNDGGEEDTEMARFEDITVIKAVVESHFERWTVSIETVLKFSFTSGRFPENSPTAPFHEVHILEEMQAILKGMAPQSVGEKPTVHDWAERSGVWDPTDILRIYRMSRVDERKET